MDMNLSKLWEIVEDRGACSPWDRKALGNGLATEQQQLVYYCLLIIF